MGLQLVSCQRHSVEVKLMTAAALTGEAVISEVIQEEEKEENTKQADWKKDKQSDERKALRLWHPSMRPCEALHFHSWKKRLTFLQWYYHNAVIWNPTGVTAVIQLWCVYYNCKHTLTATLPGTPFPLQHCRSALWHRFDKVLAPFLVVHTDMIVSYACCRFEVSCYITS